MMNIKKRCRECRKLLCHAKFYSRKKSKDGLRENCISCSRRSAVEYYWKKGRQVAHRKWLRVKQEFVKAYGGKCYCCGERELTFLTLDHIRGGGMKHREKIGHGTSMYLFAKREGYPKDKYRCACMNCNLATMRERICPHRGKN